MKPQERHAAIFASKVEPSVKLLLMAVASYLTDTGGACYASPETLAAMTGLARSTVIGMLGEGVEAGYLRRFEDGHKAKTTEIVWDALATSEPKQTKRGGVRSSDGAVRSSDASDVRTAPSEHRTNAVRSSDCNRPNIGPDPGMNRGEEPERGSRARGTTPTELTQLFPEALDLALTLARNHIASVEQLLDMTQDEVAHSKGLGHAVAKRVVMELAKGQWRLKCATPRPERTTAATAPPDPVGPFSWDEPKTWPRTIDPLNPATWPPAAFDAPLPFNAPNMRRALREFLARGAS